MNATTWPDGERRSTDNGFVLGMGETPHGYEPGSEVIKKKPRVQHYRNGNWGGAQSGTQRGLERRK